MTTPSRILLIMSDQHRHDLMGCAGRDKVPTPNLDRLAKQSTRFTDAYCPSPLCLPSRMAFMTGKTPPAIGINGNYDLLDLGHRTIADHFSAHGYLTGLIGKMHFRDAANHGFQYYLSINDWLAYLGPKAQHYADEIASNPITPKFAHTVRDAGSGFPDVDDLWDDASSWAGKVTGKDYSHMVSELSADDTLDMFVARETVRACKRFADRPFFIVAGFMRPHPPMFPPRPWDSLYPVDDVELPEAGPIDHFCESTQGRIAGFEAFDPKLRRADRAGYYGNLAFLDHCIGELLDGLEAEGLMEETLILYTSDHGDMDGEHGLLHKGVLLEPSVRVPFLASWPGQIPAGGTCDAPINLIDLYATLSELAGLPAPEEGVGQSFAELLLNPRSDSTRTSFVCMSTDHRMIRRGDWKYVWHEDDREELFNLADDPGELVNHASDTGLQELMAELRADLLQYYA